MSIPQALFKYLVAFQTKSVSRLQPPAVALWRLTSTSIPNSQASSCSHNSFINTMVFMNELWLHEEAWEFGIEVEVRRHSATAGG